MKAEFLKPKFNGARFAEHTLPVEVARDLAAYETLVIELAKHLYMRENPTRQRVSKGFGDQFHLHIERIEEGSSVPVLAAVLAGALPFSNIANPYFERARDLVAICVAAPKDKLPEEFPRELLTHFNQFGRSLREDESVQLDSNAVLTPQRRKELVLAASKVYEREIELAGTISEADWDRSTFRLRMADNTYAIVPMSEAFHPKAREFGGRDRFLVTVKAVGSYNSWEKLQKIVSVTTVEIQPQYQLTSKFEALAAIEDGWYEGWGRAPISQSLTTVADKFIALYPDELALPIITPTPEGNLLFEWDAPGSPSVDLDLLAMKAEFHAFGGDDTDIEHDFLLISDEEWSVFFTFLTNYVESGPE